MLTVKELNNYKVKQLKILAAYEGKTVPKNIRKAQLIDLLVQLPLPEVETAVEEVPCSVRVKRIRESSKEN